MVSTGDSIDSTTKEYVNPVFATDISGIVLNSGSDSGSGNQVERFVQTKRYSMVLWK